MNRLFSVLAAGALLMVVTPPAAVHAEFESGTVELSLSPSIEIVSQHYDGEDADAETIIMLPFRVGVFVTPAFEIEGDINVTSSDNSTGMWAFLNAAYNFSTDDNKVVPFVLAGVGVGNAVRVLGLAFETDENVFGFDLGVGMKFPMSEHVAFRFEYRYDRVSYTEENAFFDEDLDVIIEGHRFLFGFSVFL